MDKLIECRDKIDEIDLKIIELFEKRMGVVKDVSQYKIEHDMEIFDPDREAKMLEKNLGRVNEEYRKYYEDVLKGYLKASKDMQKEIIDSYKKGK